jgi:hypothetical protein
MRGIGSYSKDGQLPIRNKNIIPKQFQRARSNGTSVYIPAYKDSSNWKDSTIRSALKNFWLAILNEKLIVQIEDGENKPVIINSKTLETLLLDYYTENTDGASWKKNSPLPYYLAYTKAKKQDGNLEVLGSVECYLLAGKADNSPNYIACFRKNLMLIQHIRFKSIIPYSGVFICTSDDGNKILQKMEPPQHDTWDSKVPHAKDDNGITLTECLTADKEYKSFLKEKIHEMLGSRTTKKIALTSLDGRISLGNDTETSDQNDASISPIGSEAHNGGDQHQIIRRSHGIIEASRINTRTNNVSKDGNNTSKKTTKKEKKNKPKPTTDPKVVGDTVANLRAFTVKDEEGLITKLIIRTTPSIKIKVHLKAGTEDGTCNVNIKSSTNGKPCNIHGGDEGDKTCISGIETDSNGEAALWVRFEEDQTYALSADFYEIR